MHGAPAIALERLSITQVSGGYRINIAWVLYGYRLESEPDKLLHTPLRRVWGLRVPKPGESRGGGAGIMPVWSSGEGDGERTIAVLRGGLEDFGCQTYLEIGCPGPWCWWLLFGVGTGVVMRSARNPGWAFWNPFIPIPFCNSLSRFPTPSQPAHCRRNVLRAYQFFIGVPVHKS
jgi:hypothetical protein